MSIVLSFMNLFILIYVAYKGSTGEQQRWETELRNTNFKDLLNELGKVNQNTTSGLDISNLRKYLEITDLNNYYYLGGEEEATLKILQEKLLENLKVWYGSINFGDLDSSKESKFEDHKRDFLTLKSDLIKFIGEKIRNRKNHVDAIIKKYTKENLVSQ